MATNVAMRLRALGGLVVAPATLVTACQTHKDAHGIERDVPHVEGELIVFSHAFRGRAGLTMSPVTRRTPARATRSARESRGRAPRFQSA